MLLKGKNAVIYGAAGAIGASAACASAAEGAIGKVWRRRPVSDEHEIGGRLASLPDGGR